MRQAVEQKRRRVYHVHMGKKRPALVTNWPQRLADLRKRLDLTQAEAAAKVRVSLRAWVKWEHGEQVPTPSHQLLIDMLEQGKI
jgi:DNA-binding transcriptional regulator YiaG